MLHGAVLGTFAPLDRGQQDLIETALTECGRVSVVLYDDPSATRVPLSVRSRWIRALYPEATVVEAWAPPSEPGPGGPEVDHGYLESLGLTDVSRFYLSPGPAAAVDPRRLHPVVRRDLVTHVVLMGAPSTGKSTLAEALAESFGTVWMPEFGRDYWNEHQVGRVLRPDQLIELAEGHLAGEEAKLLEATGILFTDTNALTTWRYGINYNGFTLPRLDELAQRCSSRYDIVLLCEPDFPHDDTWERSGDGVRQVMQRQIEADLIERRIPFFRVGGPVEDRVRAVRRLLDGYEKYTPITGLITA